MQPCLAENVVLDLLEGTLAAEAISGVDAHLASCPSCRRLISELSRGSDVTSRIGADSTTRDGGLRAAASPHPELSRGDRVGRYVVLSRVGAGAMGVVYAALDPELDRRVALKLINVAASDGSDLHERRIRLQREAQAMARLSHPCVVTVHDVGEFDGAIFLAMELIDGITLREWLSAETRTWPVIRDALLRAGQGLQAAHRAGLVHRDFKLDNVLVDRDGRVCVTDFGLARPLRSAEPQPRTNDGIQRPSQIGMELTRTGAFIGTPVNMAPEVLLGETADALSDQFSFCVALYEALYGERPFPSGDLEVHTRAKQHGRVRPPPRGSRVPRFLRRTVLRGLSPQRKDRYPSMEELLRDLGRAPWLTLRRGLVAACGLVGLVLVLGAGAYLSSPRRLCSGAERRFAGVWDSERRGAVQRALLGTGTPLAAESLARIAPLLDSYRRDWIAMHIEACEATRVVGTQSDELLSLRMDCLDRRRDEVSALTELLLRIDSRLLVNTLTAVHALTPLAVCSDRAALTSRVRPPEDRALRARVEKVRIELSRAQTLDQTGRFSEGLQLAERAVAEARGLGYRPLLAEALHLRGLLESHAGHTQLAERVLLEAVSVAEASRHDEIAARAWIEILSTIRIMRPLDSQLGETLATAAVQRIGDTGVLHAQLLDRLGMLREAQGRYADAAESYRGALARLGGGGDSGELLSSEILGHLAVSLGRMGKRQEQQALLRQVLRQKEKALGPAHPLLGDTLEALADVTADRFEHAEAEALYRRALELREEGLEPGDPRIAESLSDLALLLHDRSRPQEAPPLLERALKINEQAYGPEHTSVAMVLDVMGLVLTDLKQYERARGCFERALAIATKTLGPEHPALIKQLDHVAMIHQRLGAHEAALPVLARALELGEKTLGPSSPELAFTLIAMARSHSALNQSRSARAALERSCKLREHEAPALLALCRYRLAVELARTGAEPARVRELLQKTRLVLLASSGEYAAILTEINRLLHDGPQPPRPH